MPEADLCRIFRVSPGPQYVIDATLVANPTKSLQVQTWNAWAATLCQRAKDQSRPIVIEHERTKYGETLTTAHFLTVKEQVA